MAERPTQPRGAGYYQRSKNEELPPKASETAAMDKGKVIPPGGAKREGGISRSQQQLGDEYDWEKVEHEDLKKLQVVIPLLLLSTVYDNVLYLWVEVHVSTHHM